MSREHTWAPPRSPGRTVTPRVSFQEGLTEKTRHMCKRHPDGSCELWEKKEDLPTTGRGRRKNKVISDVSPPTTQNQGPLVAGRRVASVLVNERPPLKITTWPYHRQDLVPISCHHIGFCFLFVICLHKSQAGTVCFITNFDWLLDTVPAST